jgi:recombination protein RecT
MKLVPFQKFQTELTEKEDEILKLLPQHIPQEKFIQTAIVAVKNEPKLLDVSRRTLHQAITEAAEDGLMPDGREGAIVIYGNEAQWQPMAHGIRKRALELAHMVIDAQIVCLNDHFVWRQGDDPMLEHIPAKLGTPRGEMIGAYAVFRRGSEILHREVMDKTEIETARNQSRGWQKSLMWTKFAGEAWRKTVVRRGIKTVPSIADLERIISRDDRNFDFAPRSTAPAADPAALESIPSAPEEPSDIAEAEVIDVVDDAPVDEVAPEPPPAAKKAEPDQSRPKTWAAFLKALKAAEKPTALNDVWAMFAKKWTGQTLHEAQDLFEKRYNELAGT